MDARLPFGWVAAAGRTASRGSNHVPRDARPCRRRWTTRLDHPDGADVLRDHLLRRGRDHVPGSDRLVRNRLRFEPPWGVDPVWLDPCKGPTYLEPIEAPANSWRLVPSWSQASTQPGRPVRRSPEDSPIVEVTGMFDHPAAQTCRNRLNYEASDYPEPDAASTILGCRTEFVVTSMTGNRRVITFRRSASLGALRLRLGGPRRAARQSDTARRSSAGAPCRLRSVMSSADPTAASSPASGDRTSKSVRRPERSRPIATHALSRTTSAFARSQVSSDDSKKLKPLLQDGVRARRARRAGRSFGV